MPNDDSHERAAAGDKAPQGTRGRSSRHAPAPRRRGRPPGSVALTDEVAQTIINLVRAGVFDYVAAEAAGVSDRTLRSWIERGEGRDPDRPATPKLRTFAAELRRARAEARAAAEVRIFNQNPRWWLCHAARSKPGRDGWTTPASEEQRDSEQHMAELLMRLERDEPDEREVRAAGPDELEGP